MSMYFLRNMHYAVFLYLFSAHAFAVTYTITTIADTQSGLDDFPDSSASINNAGTVAYKGELASGAQNIYTSTSGTPLVSDEIFNSEPVINNNGTVTVSLEDGSGVTGIYNCTAGAFIIDSNSSSFNNFGVASVNDSDVIAFIADSSINTTPPLNTVADTSGPLADFAIADINNTGTAMYVADLDAGDQGVYRSSSSTAIFTGSFIPSAAINNTGTVAYTDTTNVYTDTTILEPSGGVFSSFNSVAINNNGTVAILGSASGNAAIYAHNGTTLDKVVAANDTIGGNTVFGVSMGIHAINDAGQIVFWATGVTPSFQLFEGIFLATPDSLLGDINGDGVINTSDYLLLTQFVLGLKTPTAAETSAGDMNQDTQLTTADMVIHVRTVLGII